MRRVADESGQTLLDYVLILFFVALLLVGALSLLEVSLSGMLSDVANMF